MADDDGFVANEDDEWKTDENEGADIFDLDQEEDEKEPVFTKKGSGAKTIFVTYQFRHFQDDYTVVGSIGEPGQFGVAYECYLQSDANQTRRCVKEINKARFHHIDSEARDEVLHTMQNEIAILKKVDHPNIVKLFDVYEDRHKLHLIMEFLPGGELFARICEKESFNEKEAVRILKQILEALDHMHDRNILHLDLKPDNILFETRAPDSIIKLIDFGMARVVPRLAKLKDRVGTPNYMAPEVFSGNYSKAADIWSVGVITFCMLFGFPPFYVDEEDIHLNEHQALEMKIKKGFSPMVKDGFGAWFPAEIPLSEDCRYLLAKMLEMDVKRRWTVKECLTSSWIRGFENASEKTIPPIVRDALKKFHHTSKFKVAISNLFRHQIDQDHIREIKKFFNELDSNNDGAISLAEFKDGMMNKFHTELSDEQLEHIFSNVDLDDDRHITFDELMTITAHRMLVDEDERLFQAFTDLDEDGDGLISKTELENAINEWESKVDKSYNEEDHGGRKRKSKHTRESTQVLKRFQSAFVTADKNGDGQLDYEEFLRILHPDFGDDSMTMDNFKSTVTNGTRVRGAQFNVDYRAATASDYVEVKPSPKAPPKQLGAQKKKVIAKTLTLDAFNKRNNSSESNVKQLKEVIQSQKIEIKRLKQENVELVAKLDHAQKDRDDMRNKYESETFSKLEQQTNEIKNLQHRYDQKSNDEKIIHEKDVLIANLNMLLDSRNAENDNLRKDLQVRMKENKSTELMLQHAIDSKMRSLEQSQAEIQKLKTMLQNSSLTTPPLPNGYNLNVSNTASQSNKKKKKARHLSHLIGDY